MKPLLLGPYSLSPSLNLKNRIIMAPMTRRKAAPDHSPDKAMADYYAKRASAGLIITEGTLITSDAIGYGNVPGIFTEGHIKSWRNVTDAVHQKNGLIFLQLWHCGRVSHPFFHQGRRPISASATTLTMPLGHSGHHCGKARQATLKEMAGLVQDYVTAAKNAMAAQFDGVEIHGANGYLVDQFLHYCSNHRVDRYGGAPENMARFCLDIITACGQQIGFDKIGLRLSPGGHMNEIMTGDKDPLIYQYLLKELEKLNIAYVHTGIFDDTTIFPALGHQTATCFLRQCYQKTLIASGGYDLNMAEGAVRQGKFDLIALGRPFIANPDLVEKFSNNVPLTSYCPTMLQELD